MSGNTEKEFLAMNKSRKNVVVTEDIERNIPNWTENVPSFFLIFKNNQIGLFMYNLFPIF